MLFEGNISENISANNNIKQWALVSVAREKFNEIFSTKTLSVYLAILYTRSSAFYRQKALGFG